jgi:predicted tellurium resistance membrane protein TerC
MIGLNFGWFLAIIIELILIGILYNLIIEWASKRGYLEANLADAIVFWVALTLIGLALLNWNAAKLAFIAFTATGLPMWFGYKWRYAQARRREKVEKREEYLNKTDWSIPQDWKDIEEKKA